MDLDLNHDLSYSRSDNLEVDHPGLVHAGHAFQQLLHQVLHLHVLKGSGTSAACLLHGGLGHYVLGCDALQQAVCAWCIWLLLPHAWLQVRLYDNATATAP